MTPKRLPLLALPLMLFQELKTWYFLFLLIGVNGLRSQALWLIVLEVVAAIGFILAFALIRYWRFSYALEAQAVTINSGLFVKKVRHIPYANIQTLRRQQWFFLQPFNLESLSIETSGHDGKNGEGTLFAVPLSVGQEIEARRHQVAAGSPAAEPTPAAESAPVAETAPQPATSIQRYRINDHDLLLYALTSLGFLPIIAVVGGIWNKVDDLIPHTWRDRAAENLAHLAVLAMVGLVILILLLAIFISFLNLLQRYYHFTLEHDASTLTATRGFFKRNTVSVRLPRIQAVRLQQSIIRQLFHLTTVQALTASNAADDENDNDLVLMPVVRTPQAYPTMQPFIDWLPDHAPTLTPVPRSSYFYYLRNIVLGNLVIVVPIVAAVAKWLPHWLGLALVIAVLWLGLLLLQGRYAARNAGVAIIDSRRIVIQRGSLWTRTQYVILRENVQSLVVASSYWMVPKHRAHLRLNVRRGDGNKELEVRYLDVATAQAVQAWYQPADA